MALIKQRRQFLPQNIGVVRPDTGDEFVTRGAERLADSLITGSFHSVLLAVIMVLRLSHLNSLMYLSM